LDKAFWRSILKNEAAVPEGHRAIEYVPELMEGLGSTDPELRDSLCVEVLCNWVNDGRFTPDELRPLADQLMDNLKAGVGQGENDQVFLRTFSVLVLRWIVEHDAVRRFFSPEELKRVFESALRYLSDEKDLRGFVPAKGWAHSAAHTGDLLFALAKHPGIGAEDLDRTLHAISAKVLASTPYPFIDREGFRLSQVVIAILRRDVLPLERVVAWLDLIGGGSTPRHQEYRAGEDNVRYHNAEAFLATLHLMLTYQDLPESLKARLLPAVHAAQKSFTPWWF